ncbi:hypothetical protein [uncultured Jannaschia sp.]|uniref:AbiU2 domain-containing protein n=1 Tax=uncultured Jannaschia sp. TaxID=293347 RepID=UPI0026248E83|nr:hypothetical protein [uncultured Jannaschia sp.]
MAPTRSRTSLRVLVSDPVNVVLTAEAEHEVTHHLVIGAGLTVPDGPAAGAFNTPQRMLLSQSVLRVCALFDKPGANRASLPTARTRLSPEAINRLVSRHRAGVVNAPPSHKPTGSDATDGVFHRIVRIDREERAAIEGEILRRRIEVAFRLIDDAERRFVGPTLRPLRDAYLAHNLRMDWTDATRPRHIVGQERRALRRGRWAVHLLHLAVNGNDFDWRSVEDKHRREARALRDHLTRGGGGSSTAGTVIP